MIQKDLKDLLLKDLCARLPYGVKISVNNNIEAVYYIDVLEDEIGYGSWLCFDVEEVKPYLFPMSSMTDEQKVIYGDLCQAIIHSLAWDMQAALNELVDWLNAHHFDYRGLIPIGLAIDATNKNIY